MYSGILDFGIYTHDIFMVAALQVQPAALANSSWQPLDQNEDQCPMVHQVAVFDGSSMAGNDRSYGDGILFLAQTVLLQAVTIMIWELFKLGWKAVCRAIQVVKKPTNSVSEMQKPSEQATPSQMKVVDLNQFACVFVGETESSKCFHISEQCTGLNFAGTVRKLKPCSRCWRKVA